jgi:hypothetical protein
MQPDQQEAEEAQKRLSKRNRVTTGMAVLMVVAAVFVDILKLGADAVPLIGWVISPLISLFAWLGFYVWTSILGWGLSDSVKKIVVMWVIPFFALIPILNALPDWTLAVCLQLFFLKAEDTIYNTTKGKVDAEKIAEVIKRVA